LTARRIGRPPPDAKGSENKMEKTTDSRIKKEKARIAKLFKNLPEERQALVAGLINRAAYMAVSLEDMEQTINDDGMLMEMSQGSYSIQRAHPLITQYNSMIKNYNSTIKLLCDNLPAAAAQQAGDALMKFVTGKKVELR